jgi:hypothetical protein
MPNAMKIIYRLKCGHNARGPSTLVSGPLYCGIHHCVSPIIAVQLFEWRAVCDSCAFARWAGMSKATAEIFAKGHMSKNRHHGVELRYDKNPEAERTQKKMDSFNGRSASYRT